MKPSTGPAGASSSDTTLGYAPGVPLLRRRRIRRWVAITLFAALVAAAWKWGPAYKERVTLLYWQHQCMTYEPPDDVVLFEPDPVKAAAILRQSVDYEATADRPGGAAFRPRCQQNFEVLAMPPMMSAMTQAGTGNEYRPVTLFVH